jgi:hypothetical protein
MKPHDGLHVSPMEERLLISSGSQSSPELYGLADESIRLFLLVTAAGEDGLPQSKVPTDLRKAPNVKVNARSCALRAAA